MPTRSIIAQQVDGQQRFRAVYCHYDGYPAGVGAILDAHYGDAEKLTRMINGGTIESLRDTPQDTVYFPRREDERAGIIEATSAYMLYRAAKRMGCDWLYIYQQGEWLRMNMSACMQIEAMESQGARDRAQSEARWNAKLAERKYWFVSWNKDAGPNRGEYGDSTDEKYTTKEAAIQEVDRAFAQNDRGTSTHRDDVGLYWTVNEVTERRNNETGEWEETDCQAVYETGKCGISQDVPKRQRI
jgi:hypothetical protein